MSSTENGAVTITADPQSGEVTADSTALTPPTDKTRDYLWLMIIGTMCLIALVVSAALVAGMFLGERPTLVSAALLLAVWTGVTGFLFGTLTPTPSRR